MDDGATQGTGFALDGTGVVTCSHVLTDGTFAYLAAGPQRRLDIAIRARNETIDLAIVDIESLSVEPLARGSADDVDVHDEIFAAGFANYRPGDSGLVLPGVVVGSRMVSGIRRLLIDARIVGGMSGGPVVDAGGRVIGVCVTGADRLEEDVATENFGVIPIDALTFLRP